MLRKGIMTLKNIANCSTVNKFVESKINKFKNSKRDFNALYELMFSEGENIIFEETVNYKIKKTTYKECKLHIENRSQNLKNLLPNANYNSVIGIYLDNGLEWIEIFWSVLKCGFRPFLINMRLDDETVFKALKEVDAIAVISNGKTFPVQTILEKDIKPDFTASDTKNDVFGEEILLTSSGTSSFIKICAYSANEFYYQILDSFSLIKSCSTVKKHYEGELKLLTVLPFYHIFGLVAVYIWFAFFSRTFVKLNDLSPTNLLSTIKKHKVTHIFAVPLFWEKIYGQAIKKIQGRGEETYAKFLKGLKIAKKLYNIPLLGKLFIKTAFKEVRENLFGESVIFTISGGSKIDLKALEFFNLIGYTLSNGYGMSEVGITSVALGKNLKILTDGRVGKPFSSVEFRIAIDGELLIKGNSVAKYVIENSQKKCYQNTWFETRDLAKEENGYYYILGRKDDLVVSVTGENLNPNIIEEKFSNSGLETCIIKDEKTSLPVLLVKVQRYLEKEKANEILEKVKLLLKEFNLSTAISKIELTVSEFLEENDFKLNRKNISKRYNSKTLNLYSFEKEVSGELDELTKKVLELFALSLNKKPSEISLTSDFFTEEGGTSLDYFALLSDIQKEFNITFSENIDGNLNTVLSLADYIKKNL